MQTGIPHWSRRIVKLKQQLINRSSSGPLCPDLASSGLYRNEHDVSTAFCPVSNATWPYFCTAQDVSIQKHIEAQLTSQKFTALSSDISS